MKSKIVRGIAAGAAAFAVAAGLGFLGLWRGLENKSWDARMRFFASPRRAASDIALVLVDQYSLDFYKKQAVSWPWPRQLYAALVGFLKAGGAKAVFFDIMMSEPSPYFAEDDEMLAQAIREAGNVVLPVFLSVEDKPSDPGAEVFVLRTASAAEGRPYYPVVFRSITAPLQTYLNAATGGANVRIDPDPDGVFRRVPLLFKYKGVEVPSVPLSLTCLAAGSAEIPDPPLDRQGRMLVRFFGPVGTYRSYPAAALLNSWLQLSEGKPPQIAPREFEGKVVLIGLSAVGLFDIKTTPLSAAVPGVEIQAAALDTLLHGRFLRSAPLILNLFLALLWAVLAATAISVLRKSAAMMAAAAGFLALPVFVAAAGFAAGLWISFVLPVAAVLAAVIGAAVLNYAVEGRQRRFLKSAFRHYLSPDVVDRVVENPGLLRLGGDRREVTSFFSDVAGFTSISESLSPEHLVGLLNEYLTAMTDIILDAGGTLDKYEGDAIVAFWNAPLDTPNHALRACRAALECRKRLAELSPDFEKRFGHPVRMRIGLNTGPAVVGNMGSARRFDYTAMGDTINLAARLESAGKQYGVSILAGEGTVREAQAGILVREIDRLRVVGKSKPVRIFELIAIKEEATAETLDRLGRFERVLEAYRRRDWEAALAECKTLPDDPVAAVYASRCERFKAEPPAADWDFVFDLKTK
jgi:adenylate cyclase